MGSTQACREEPSQSPKLPKPLAALGCRKLDAVARGLPHGWGKHREEGMVLAYARPIALWEVRAASREIKEA